LDRDGNGLVIASEARQSMTPDYMDRHASLAMTVQGLPALSDWMRQACNDMSIF
jgi:hypothetical protein